MCIRDSVDVVNCPSSRMGWTNLVLAYVLQDVSVDEIRFCSGNTVWDQEHNRTVVGTVPEQCESRTCSVASKKQRKQDERKQTQFAS